MTEDQNDQTTGEPVGDPAAETAPTPAPEATSGSAEATARRPSRCRPLPRAAGAAAPPPRAARHAPDGRGPGHDSDRGHDPGAGHLRHGRAGRQPHARSRPCLCLRRPAPTDPGAPVWTAPPAPAAAAGTTNHRVRNGLLAGAAALAVLGAGIGIGHATTQQQRVEHAGFCPLFWHLPRAFGLRVLRWLGGLGQPLRQRLPVRGRQHLGGSGQLRQWQLGLVELLGAE